MSVSQMKVNHNAGCSLVRARSTEDQLKPRGRFVVEHFRNGVKIGQYEFPNGITNEGKNKLLDVMFHAVSPVTTWWLGMIDNAGYTAQAATDTYANIGQSGNQWAEFTGYTDAANGATAPAPAPAGPWARPPARPALMPARWSSTLPALARSLACSWWVASPTPRTRATTRPAACSGPPPRSAPATCRSIPAIS